MMDLLIGLAFVAMLIVPAVVATLQRSDAQDSDVQPEHGKSVNQ
ncbi:hypothetical protein ACOBR2_03405 [Telmatobacter bradus]